MAEPPRGRVRSPIRRPARQEHALVQRWENAAPDDLWSILDAAWLTGITATTLRHYIDAGTLIGATTARGHRAVRTEDLRPLVEVGGRTYGPDIAQ